MSENNKNVELGALWARTGAKGDYFSGTVTVEGKKVEIVVFPNSYKNAENQPDYRIMLSNRPAAPANAAPAPKKTPAAAPKRKPAPAPVEDTSDDTDVAF